MKFVEKLIWIFLNGYRPKENESEVMEFDYYDLIVKPKREK